MKNRHIKKNLDAAKFEQMPAAEASAIAEHIKTCADCRAAFQAASVASILLKEKSSLAAPAPTPFFQAKVLNAWREKQIVPKPFAVFRRWWQASATLVLLMCLAIGGLITATVIGARTATASRQNETDEILYSPETVILNQNPPRNLTTEQLFEFLDENK